jgi:hypothetical protein
VNVAWIVITLAGLPLVSAVVVTVFAPAVKPLAVTPVPPLAVAVVKPPVPLAVSVAGAPAGVLVYEAITVKALAPAAVAVTLVVLAPAGMAMPRPASSAKRAAKNARGCTERMKSPPSKRLKLPAAAVKWMSPETDA